MTRVQTEQVEKYLQSDRQVINMTYWDLRLVQVACHVSLDLDTWLRAPPKFGHEQQGLA